MPISIELKPEVEERLGREAQAVGLSVEAYVEDLIEQQVSRPHKTFHVDSKEIDQFLDSLAEGSGDLPALQPAAHTRETIYQDHD